MLRHMTVQRFAAPLLSVACVALAAACGGDQAASSAADGETQRKPQPSATLPLPVPSSALRYTDCDPLAPGDALNFVDFACEPGNARQWQSMDCKSGAYVRLAGSTGTDLEGIAGSTPTWLAADPIDSRYGRTPWAFINCLEHG